MAAKKSTEPELRFPSKGHFARWLAKNHAKSTGVLLVIAKKASNNPTITYAEAVDVALAWGWIDGVKRRVDDESWHQRFTPRTARSQWSKINREKATALIAAGEMRKPGLNEVERAKQDGRWKSAYDSAKISKIPADLTTAMAANKRAHAFFQTIDAANRYAILYRVQTAKKPETRAERIRRFVQMLAKHETLHPPRAIRQGAARSTSRSR